MYKILLTDNKSPDGQMYKIWFTDDEYPDGQIWRFKKLLYLEWLSDFMFEWAPHYVPNQFFFSSIIMALTTFSTLLVFDTMDLMDKDKIFVKLINRVSKQHINRYFVTMLYKNSIISRALLRRTIKPYICTHLEFSANCQHWIINLIYMVIRLKFGRQPQGSSKMSWRY